MKNIKIITIFSRFYKNLIHLFWHSPPIYIIASLSIIFYISHWIIAGDIILSDFMQVVYCQPIDNSSLGQVDNVSEITNAEVIIQPKNNQLAGESGPSQGLNSVKVSLEEKKVNVSASAEYNQVKSAISHLGAGTAAGYVGAAIVKSMQSSTLPAKVAAGAIGAGVTGATFILGSKAADIALSNVSQKTEVLPSPMDRPSTPTEHTDVFSASSLLDSVESDTPLVSMINILFEFVNLELILLLVLIFLVLKQRFKIGTLILTFIKNKIPQDKPYQIKIHTLFDKLIVGNDQVDQLLIIIYLFLMLMVKLVLLYFMYDLKLNINDYVYVYNKIKSSLP